MTQRNPQDCVNAIHSLHPELISKQRRDILRASLALGANAAIPLGALLGAGSSMAQGTPKSGGSIRVATAAMSAADTLDPAKGAYSTDYVRHNMIYSGLTELDATLSARMALATSMDTKDSITWVAKLRSGVQFHDGKPFGPADVVFSLLRHKDPATASKSKTLADQIKEVKQTGPMEVTIVLTGPNADLPVILGTSQFLIIKDGTKDFTTAVGTGPFKLKEFTPGVRTVGVKNPNYWKPGKPYLDQVELFGIGDESARVNALLAGDVHLISAIKARSAGRIKGASGFAVMETKTGQYTNLIMRDEGGITGNRDFREGMKYLFDREQMRKAIFEGYGVIGNDQPIDPGNKYYFSGLPQRAFDLDKAKFHFQKANVGSTPLQIFASQAAEGSIEMGLLLQQAAARAGVKLAINRVPADGYWANHWMKHPMTFGDINARPSADILFTQLFKSDAPWNEANWKNEKFDQLLVAARGERDEAKRKQMYGDMQVLVANEGGVGIPMFRSWLDGYSSKLKGMSVIPLSGLMGCMFAENVWLEG